jgi:hypothetical protein
MIVEVRFVEEMADFMKVNGVKFRHFGSVVEADKFAKSVKDSGGLANVFLDGVLLGTFFEEELDDEEAV